MNRSPSGSWTLAAVLGLWLLAPPAAVEAGVAMPQGGSSLNLVMDEAYGTGPVVRAPGGPVEFVTVQISDSFQVGRPPRDTIPAGSRIEFRWHAEPAERVAGYRYKLDEPGFVAVDSSVRAVSYNTGVGGDVVAPGLKVFTLRVLDDQGLMREITRYFQMNYSPDTWFSGPDLSLYPLDPVTGERFVEIADWFNPPDFPGSLMDCDSFTVLPAERPERRTFFEIYRDRVYVRSEGDTVHMNSWVVLHSGGSDLDSPYGVIVAPNDPGLLDTLRCPGPARVVRPGPLNGSAIGFRHQRTTFLSPNGPVSTPSQSLLYPSFDPNSVFRSPVIAGYQAMTQAGKVYAVTRASDGLARDNRIANARELADKVDRGEGTPEEVALRSRILTFHVDKAPRLLFDAPGFVPRPGQVFITRTLDLNLLADDVDPLDPDAMPPRPGGPSETKVLRWNVTLRGRDANGDPVSVSPLARPVFDPRITVTVPEHLADSLVTVEVQLCDCSLCEITPGQGRCADYPIPIVVPPGVTSTLASLIAADASPGLVRVRWLLSTSVSARVERRGPQSVWREVGEVLADGSGKVTYEDHAVEAGARYGYRLVLSRDGREATAGEVWVEVPLQAEFALEGLRPNPAVGGDLTVHFSLPSAEPARIEVLDVSGRRLIERDLGALGPGRHAVNLGAGVRVPPGVYLLRLIQGGRARMARAAVLN